jgi:hypothetical protein
MALEIQFKALAPVDRTVELNDVDLATVDEIIRESFLGILPYSDVSMPINGWEVKAKNLLDKYGVDPTDKRSRQTFFQAILKKCQ